MVKSNSFCYKLKVINAITLWKAIEKFSMLQYKIRTTNKNCFAFGLRNILFANSIIILNNNYLFKLGIFSIKVMYYLFIKCH